MRGLIIIFCLTATGCHSLNPNRIKAGNRDEMAAAVWEKIPLGTPIEDALTTMKAAGFACEMVEGGDFTEAIGMQEEESERRSLENADFISCELTESAGFPVANVWHVAIVADESDKVADVLVKLWRDGL